MAHAPAAAADNDAPAVTQALARFVATHPSRGWNDAVEAEAHRTLLNWLGCAIGAAHHDAVSMALAACQVLQPAPQAAVLGRRERVDIGSAAFINGIASHTFDFDDTHLRTIIHPAGPVASALLSLGEHLKSPGRALIDALVLGIEVSCRLGNMVYPDHYDRGWHITGSTGVFGAAAGCARLLGLDEIGTQMALGIAASQPVGLREQFGSMTKPLHPGAAARVGLMAALLAREGYTSSLRSIEARRGWAQVVSTRFDWREATDGLGERFEISANSYKPYACGIVIHPSIEACVGLRAQGVAPSDVQRIELRVHPLVLELTGKSEPEDGLQAKFSVFHGCAAGLIFGRAGEAEFADAVVTQPAVIELRRRVHATAVDDIAEDAVNLTAWLVDGRQLQVRIDHAVGSSARPMSDEALDAKFMSLVAPVIGERCSKSLLRQCRGAADLSHVEELVALASN
ncbi:MAG: MmgE/PrpD family protein [Burkholderiales bacterium]|nr:MmgE/PrpD family protein [Burkholderiales bacterium]